MTISARVVEHSIAPHGVELITLEVVLPTSILAELNTHGMVSKCSSSVRATPAAVFINRVKADPFFPVFWAKNGRGMQGKTELDEDSKILANLYWLDARDYILEIVEKLRQAGCHKGDISRLLTPWMYTKSVLTATDRNWNHFFALRMDADAKKEFQMLAVRMGQAIRDSCPVERGFHGTPYSESWCHLPYITQKEREQHSFNLGMILFKMSAARCARTSYLTNEGKEPDWESDLALYNRLVGGRNVHASPLAHQGTPLHDPDLLSGNFNGWRQYRKMVPCENQIDFDWRARLKEYEDAGKDFM